MIEFGADTPAREATRDRLPERERRFFVSVQSLSPA
jgi:hypothetical protein